MTDQLGFSGRIAQSFQDNQLTPLLALAALLMTSPIEKSMAKWKEQKDDLWPLAW